MPNGTLTYKRGEIWWVDLSQMRAVDAQRIKHKQGVLEDTYWEAIEKAVCIELGFSLAFKST